MVSDPIADMLTRIRNAQAVEKPEVEIPFSRIKYEIAKILKQKGFIKDVRKLGRGIRKMIIIDFKYEKDLSAIAGLKRVSKPGQRIYHSAQEIRKVRGGYGMSIISTSQGLMTGREAKSKKIGGELLCEIW